MKKVKKIGLIIVLLLIILISLHILSLVSYIPSNYLWDQILFDNNTFKFSEIISILSLSIITYFNIYNLIKIKKKRKRKNLLFWSKIILIYFCLLLLGSFLGTDTMFRTIGISFYSILIFFEFIFIIGLTNLNIIINKKRKKLILNNK